MTRRPNDCRITACRVLVVARTHQIFVGFLPLLGNEVVREEVLVSTTWTLGLETSQRAVYAAQVAVQLPSNIVTSAIDHEGLTGPRLVQARSLQMSPLLVRAQRLSCLRPGCLLLPTQMGQRIQPVPEGPHQSSGRLHLGAGWSLHPVLYKSTHAY